MEIAELKMAAVAQTVDNSQTAELWSEEELSAYKLDIDEVCDLVSLFMNAAQQVGNAAGAVGLMYPAQNFGLESEDAPLTISVVAVS